MHALKNMLLCMVIIHHCLSFLQVPSDADKKIPINTPIALLVEEGEDWQNVEIPSEAQASAAPAISSEQPAAEAVTPVTPGKVWVLTALQIYVCFLFILFIRALPCNF